MPNHTGRPNPPTNATSSRPASDRTPSARRRSRGRSAGGESLVTPENRSQPGAAGCRRGTASAPRPFPPRSRRLNFEPRLDPESPRPCEPHDPGHRRCRLYRLQPRRRPARAGARARDRRGPARPGRKVAQPRQARSGSAGGPRGLPDFLQRRGKEVGYVFTWARSPRPWSATRI